MRYQLQLPARINVLGNPADANEGDFAVISAAVDLFAGALVEPAGQICLEGWAGSGGPPRVIQVFDRQSLPLPYDGNLDLVKGAINRLHQFSPEFRKKLADGGVRICTWTNVPRQSGLGGSSLFVLLALAALRARYCLDPVAHHDYALAELTQRVEALELGITCGFADRYVPLFGGLAYVDYRGKLQQAAMGDEPLATYERLDSWVKDLPLVVINTGLAHDSGDVHGQLRPLYLAEHAAWQAQGGQPPPMVHLMQQAYETAWRGKHALLRHAWVEFGRLMDRNHQLVDAMMRYCGFSDGAGWANNLMIETAAEHGALGAKLTGAGGGGSVFALVAPGQEAHLMEACQQVAEKAGLTELRLYRPHIVPEGLVVSAATN